MFGAISKAAHKCIDYKKQRKKKCNRFTWNALEL